MDRKVPSSPRPETVGGKRISQHQSRRMHQMIANADVAKRVADLVLEGYNRIEQSMKLVEENSNPQEFASYKRAVGKVTAAILFEILDRGLYRRHLTRDQAGVVVLTAGFDFTTASSSSRMLELRSV